eukprot:m.29604 g.29604  ORF g.29604 m.29604 type:complete len:573 (-) comp8118_c0_seq3:106-1824(-)
MKLQHVYGAWVLFYLTQTLHCVAKKKFGTSEWWPEEVRETIVNFSNAEQPITWPPVSGFHPTGRVSTVRAAWEPPLPNPKERKQMQDPIHVHYWEGTAANVAYGHVMNTFMCLKLGTAEAIAWVNAIREYIPESIRPEENSGAFQQSTKLKLGKLPLRVTSDEGVSQLEVEMQGPRSRQHPRGQYWVWLAVLGSTYYLDYTDHITLDEAKALGINTEVYADQEKIETQIWISATYDRDRSFNVMEFRAAAVPQSDNVTPKTEEVDLDIMTFNVWNTNPPNWLYRQSERTEKYMQRMSFLCDIISRVGAPIVALQEVRYDETIGGHQNHFQMKHIMDKLPGHQYVYVPAMSYYKAREMQRVEEGPAIISKYPIISSDYIILSRDVLDERDIHQRICLHVCVDVPNWGPVDVFTVHLSLLEKARDQSVLEIWDVISNKSVSKGVTQILMGDLNAEPQENAMRFLSGEIELEGAKTDFIDAWLALHPEPEPRSNDTNVKKDMLTFPSDDPTKRIDFIFIRGKGSKNIKKTWLVGQDPLPDIGRDKGEEGEHLGMVHKESKVWASDHRGLVTTVSS